MANAESGSPQIPPLDLSALPLWLVEQGMRGLPLAEQIDGFCSEIVKRGFPMKRAQMGMFTLHPRYGAHSFVWQSNAPIEHKPRARSALDSDTYLKSPVHHMRSQGLTLMRCRLDEPAPQEFLIFPELRAEGLVDYAAFIVPHSADDAAAFAREAAGDGELATQRRTQDGTFFSCATDRKEGFDERHIAQIAETLPYIALGAKSRLTYDVANIVLSTYLGSDASERVLTGNIVRGSTETIRAVIWFADLRGFTALTDSLPGALLVETLNDYLEAMAAPVHKYGGQILKFMGDGLLATFTLDGRNDAEICLKALRAAEELRNGLPTFNAERRASDKPVMQFGLALHLGEVFYGNIGASERLDFTVIGPAVNEASRIQALCKQLENPVLVSSSFHAATGRTQHLDFLGTHTLRGVQAPQEVYGLTKPDLA